jgi:hypothetical protein
MSLATMLRHRAITETGKAQPLNHIDWMAADMIDMQQREIERLTKEMRTLRDLVKKAILRNSLKNSNHEEVKQLLEKYE